MKNFWRDFKAFISRGNIVDMAVGVIIGSAFSAIITALTDKILMPIINLILSAGGGGLEDAYTILKPVYTETLVDDKVVKVLDLTKSIYIDWGAFITAILNFILIALTLFLILRIMMKAKGYLNTANSKRLTAEQKTELVSRGVNLKDKEAVKAALAQIEAEAKAKAEEEAKANYKPTDNELLTEIRDLLKDNKSNKK